MDPELLQRFRASLDGCLQCGLAAPTGSCASCGGPGAWAPLVAPPAAEPLGHLVQGRVGLGRRQGVVVEAQPEQVTILRTDGSLATLPRRRIVTLAVAAGQPVVRSAAGSLAAATTLDLPPGTRELVWRYALRHADYPSAVRALAADCAGLGLEHLVAFLPLPPSEQIWWRASARWRRGDWAAAAGELLNLPAGRYPQRLLLWWWAAVRRAVPAPLRPAILAAARHLGSGSPAALIATHLLLAALGEGRFAGDRELVAAAHQLGGADRTHWWDGRRRPGTAARLLAAWSGAAVRPSLRDDPAVLDRAPEPVLDDLVDRGRIPAGTELAGLARSGYLRARLAIDSLDEAELIAVGAHEERARRYLVAGRPLPPDLPDPARERFARLAAARGGDPEALAAVAGAAGLPSGPLSTVLAGHTTLPAPELMADPTLARWLLERSQLDPVGLPADGLDESQRRFAGRLALRRAKQLLYRWDWPATLEAARACLRLARAEQLRDEAQNLMAAAHWQLGNDQAASAALSAALDGEYTAALQVNYAVVAAELEPQQTAAHLSRLVSEAPDLPLRVSAAYQAIRLWRSDEQWQHGEPLPAVLAGALRALVVAPVEYPVFRDLVRLLATHDSAWLARRGALDGSPHRATPAARVWVGNAQGPEPFVTELARQLRGEPEPWLGELHEQLLRDLITELNPPGPDTPWTYGVLLFDKRMPMPPTYRVVLLALTVNSLLSTLDPNRSEPAEKWLRWLEETIAEVDRLPAAEADPLRALLHLSGTALTDAFLTARRVQLGQARQLYQTVRPQVESVPRYALNRAAVWDVVRPGVEFCEQTRRLLERLRRVGPPELRPAIDELQTGNSQLHRWFRQLYA